MNLGTPPAKTMDTLLFSDIRSIAPAAEKIKRRFGTMGTPQTLRDSVLDDCVGLEVAMDADGLGVSVKHFGTTIKFKCLIALAPNNEPIARVICSLDHLPLSSTFPLLLGSFTFTLNGMTDLPGNERGVPTNLPADADRIIAYFLHKAHRTNATLFASDAANPSE
jgi:hypothetical protein